MKTNAPYIAPLCAPQKVFFALLALICFMIGNPNVFGQDKKKDVFQIVEKRAEFPGRLKAMQLCFMEHMECPEKALKKKKQGRVMLEVIVNTDGELSDIKVKRGVCECIDEEAIRLVKQLPKFKPAENKGKVVNSYYSISVPFRLP